MAAGLFSLGMLIASELHGLTQETKLQWNNLVPTKEDLSAIAYGHGRWLFANPTGFLLTSTNLETWSAVPGGATIGINGLAFGADRFVGVGNAGIVTSVDGLTWTAPSLETPYWLTDVTYGGGLFVAVGPSGTLVTSADGAVWTARDSRTTNQLYGVVHNGDRFIAVGESGTIVTSTDGSSWDSVSSGVDWSLRSIDVGPGGFVAIGLSGGILKSLEGRDWEIQAEPVPGNTFYSIACGPEHCAAVGGAGAILENDNTEHWNPVSVGRRNFLLRVLYADGQFVAAGGRGAILTSLDGTTWNLRTLGGVLNSVGIGGVVYGNRQFVAVGSLGTVLNSPDGLRWTAVNSEVNYHLSDVVYGNGVFLAMGPREPTIRAGGAIVSADGVHWTQTWSNHLSSATFTGDRFVIADGGNLWESRVGTNWVRIAEGSAENYSLAYGNGVYVGTGTSGSLYRLMIGADWVRTSLGSFTLLRVIYHENRFYATGPGIFVSHDGLNWDWIDAQAGYPNGLAFGLGLRVLTTGAFAVDRAQRSPGSIWSSRDGTNWVQNLTLSTNALATVAYGAGRFVAVGSEIILTSGIVAQVEPPQLEIRLVTGQVELAVHGQDALDVDVEASRDLRAWTVLGTSRLTNSTAIFLDAEPLMGHRFYRARQRP